MRIYSWCRAEFASGDEDGEGFGVGVYMTRALACEVVACDLTSSLSAAEALQYLCHELSVLDVSGAEPTESSYLLSGQSNGGGSGGADVENGRRKRYEGASEVKRAAELGADGVASRRNDDAGNCCPGGL